MTCVPSPAVSELEFTRAFLSRMTSGGVCAGPLVELNFSVGRMYVLQRVVGPDACAVLWHGFRCDTGAGLIYGLCAAHWFDVAALVFVQAVRQDRDDWLSMAEELLRDLCCTANWDAKEIVNMFAWQRHS